MDKAKRDLIRKVFNGASGSNKLAYSDLMEAHALRNEVANMGTLKKLWIVGFVSSAFSSIEAEDYNKNLNDAMLRYAKWEYKILKLSAYSEVSYPVGSSLDNAIDRKQRVHTLLSSSGHKPNEISSIFDFGKSPERVMNNVIRNVAIRDGRKLTENIETKLQAGKDIKEGDLVNFRRHAHAAAQTRSIWDGKVNKFCSEVIQCELKIAKAGVAKDASVSNLDRVTTSLENLVKENYAKNVSRANRKEITRTFTEVKNTAIAAVEAELQKPQPDSKVIKAHAKILKEHKSLRKTMDGHDKEVMAEAGAKVKEIEKAAKASGQPTTRMSFIEDILSAFRGQQISMGRP